MIRNAIAEWMGEIIVFGFLTTIILGIGVLMAYSETHQRFVVPRCAEDQTIGYAGQCLTVDDSDFRGGYWFPKE